jgi:putative FmdB family regulatory protein
MPTYEYRCKDCGNELEAYQAFTDDPLTECPSCGGSLKKKFGSVGISFKGAGFYKNDARGGSSSASSSGSGDASSSGSGTSTGSDTSTGSGTSTSSGSSDSSGASSPASSAPSGSSTSAA